MLEVYISLFRSSSTYLRQQKTLDEQNHEMHLRDLVPSVQFKKREKQPWKSVTSAYNFTKTNTPPWVFSCFLNCTNATKSRNISPMRLFF